jgi:hypothetical protein
MREMELWRDKVSGCIGKLNHWHTKTSYTDSTPNPGSNTEFRASSYQLFLFFPFEI